MEIKKIKKTRPKIIYLVDTWFPYDDGRPTYVAKLAQHLVQEEGYDVEILTCKMRGKLRTDEKTLESLEGLRIRRFNRWFFVWASTFILLTQKPRPILAHANGTLSAMAMKIASWWTKIPTVVTVHSTRIFQRKLSFKKLFHRVMYLETKYTQEISVSEALLRATNVNDPVLVIPQGMDCAAFDRVPNQHVPESFRVLTVGPLEWEKGLDLLLEAMARTVASHEFIQSKKDFLLQIVGEGSQEALLKQKVKDLTLSRHVQFLKRPSSTEELVALYKGADLFVLPSRVDALPLTLLEACAARLPILATDTGDHKKLVLPNVNGQLIQPEDVEELAYYLGHFALNPSLKDWGEASRALVEQEFSWESCFKKTVRVYERLGYRHMDRRLPMWKLPIIPIKKRRLDKLLPGKKPLRVCLTVNLEQAPGSHTLPEEDEHVMPFLENYAAWTSTLNIPTTIFVGGELLPIAKEKLLEFQDRGHEIGLKAVQSDWESIPARRKSLRHLRDLLNEAGFEGVRWFRPPTDMDDDDLSVLHEFGFEYVPTTEDPLPTVRFKLGIPHGWIRVMNLEEWLKLSDEELLRVINRIRAFQRQAGMDPYLIFEASSFESSGESFTQLSKKISFLRDQMDLDFMSLSDFVKSCKLPETHE